jgi:hypothetical protein
VKSGQYCGPPLRQKAGGQVCGGKYKIDTLILKNALGTKRLPEIQHILVFTQPLKIGIILPWSSSDLSGLRIGVSFTKKH